MLEWFALDSGDSRSWSYFPYAAKRIADFCKKYDSDADVLMMVTQLKLAFVHPKPSAQILIVLKDGKVIGHVLSVLEEWFGTRIATVVQIESDEALPHDFNQEMMAHIEAWSRELDAKFLQAMARNEALGRMFSTFYGFNKRAVVMRKTLSEAHSTEVAHGLRVV